MLSRLQFRVRNRRVGSGHYALFGSLNSSAFAQSMLSCVVLLLIVEMISPQPHHTLYVDQFAACNASPMPGASLNDAAKIMLTRDGTIYFGNRRVSSEALPEQLRERVRNQARRKVFLVIDQRAKYWDVSAVLDDVRQAGIWDIALLTEKRASHK